MTNYPNTLHRQPCEKFGDQDYARYVRLEMPERDAKEFEAHATTCSGCLLGIRHATVAYQRQKGQKENALLYTRTLSLMDRLDQSVFTIVIRAVQGVVELVRSTGEQMVMTPLFSGVRSSLDVAGSETVRPLRLVKEFEESRLSVEVTLSPVKPDMLDIIVSLLDRQIEEFMPGVSVSCCSENETHDEITDDNGQACFRIPAAGFYELVLKKDGHLLGTMTLTGL